MSSRIGDTGPHSGTGTGLSARQPESSVRWVILTVGNRPRSLADAFESLRTHSTGAIAIVDNGGGIEPLSGAELLTMPLNVGIPGGRDAAVRNWAEPIFAFLDDDAAVLGGWAKCLAERFEAESDLGAVCFRLVDEDGDTSRRHVPRMGRSGSDRPGDVGVFLGGACAIRRDAYIDAGGYWPDLWYGHEELDLSWRMIDRGWRIEYDPAARVFHPRTIVGRYAEGWWYTGRNRVMVARRNLPWAVAIVHVTVWLAGGVVRAEGLRHKWAYVRGWSHGWGTPVRRDPVSWRTVWKLSCLRRPPIL